jgi:hypothetical protein
VQNGEHGVSFRLGECRKKLWTVGPTQGHNQQNLSVWGVDDGQQPATMENPTRVGYRAACRRAGNRETAVEVMMQSLSRVRDDAVNVDVDVDA